jgi:molecular chaperone GrpE (heat shock protein)
MKNLFSTLLKPRRVPAPAGDSVPSAQNPPVDPAVGLLGLQKETQALRMDLQISGQTIANLKQENERLRLRQDQVIEETVDSRLSSLFGDLAGPASQILTQADLLEKQGKPVQSRDVLSVARRMVRALERYGVAFTGQVGEQVSFDPNQHTPINEAVQPQPGQLVTIRFAGVTYRGKTIYKAIVE